MVSNRLINCTYNVVSRSPAYPLIVNLNHYSQKRLILASTLIVYPRRKMSPVLNGSIRPSRNVSDLPERPYPSGGFINE